MALLIPEEELVVSAPEARVVEGDGGESPRLEFEFKIRQADRELAIGFSFWNIEPVLPVLGAEAAVALTLLPAMRLGSPLRIEGEVDRQMLAGIERMQEIFHTWYPEFTHIPVEAGVVDRSGSDDDQRDVAVFFTGGLDSTYTLRKNKEEITQGVYVHGFDIPLDDTACRERVSQVLGEAAEAHGVRLIEGESNIRELSDMIEIHWGYHYHGSCLAAVAMLLSGSLRKMFIASSGCYDRLVPWGSTYTLDPLWNTAHMELDHDGSEYDRLGKVRALANDDLALRYMRVCYQNPEQGTNCGRCEKCLRTMVALRLCGALERCEVFNEPLDLKWLCESEEMRREVGIHTIWGDFKMVAEQQGDDPELLAALTEVLSWPRNRRIIRELCANKRDLTVSEPWRQSLPKFRRAVLDSFLANDPDWLLERIQKWPPELRDEVFDRLWQADRRSVKRRYRSARRARLLERLRVTKRKSE